MNQQKTSSSCYHVKLFFQEDSVMENVKAYTLVFKLIDKAEEIYFLPEDIVDNSETSTTIRENGFEIFIRSKMGYGKLKDQLNTIMSMEQLTLNIIDESFFKPFLPVPENMRPIKPFIKMRRKYWCRTC